MNKAKKVLALLMALCMAFGMLSVSAFAADLQALINAAPANGTIDWSGTSGPVTISKNITINFADGAMVWSNEAKPAITIADGAKVTLNGVTAGVTSPVNFDNFDAADLPDAYLAASVPAIRVANNAELTLKNAVVTGGEAKIVSTDIYAPVGAGVETYDNSVVNVENSVVFGSWGVENTSKTVVNISATSIVAGYMDATNALYKTNVVGTKLSSKELVEAFINFELDEEQTPIAEDIFGDRIYLVVDSAPEAVTGLAVNCVDGEAVVSFDKEDTLWVPTTFTLGEDTQALTLSGDKYTATFTGVESGNYDYSVDYQLRTDLGDAAETINTFVDRFARYYWPDLNDNVNDAIDHLLAVAADEFQPMLVDAYKEVRKLQKEANNDDSAIKAFKNDLKTISKEMHWVLGNDIFEEVVGTPYEGEEPITIGTYFTVLKYFQDLKACDGTVAKAAFIRDNYANLWTTIAGDDGDTIYAHVKNIYNVLQGGLIAQMVQAVADAEAEIAAHPDEATQDAKDAVAEMKKLTQQITDLKAQIKDIIDAIAEAKKVYNDVIGGDEFQDYLAFASNEYLAEGDRLFTNIKDYYAPDFEGTKLLVKEAVIEGAVDVENIITVVPVDVIRTTVSVGEGAGKVVSSTGIEITSEQTIIRDSKFTLTATPEEGNVFLFWTNAETNKVWSYDESITITPTNDKSLKAYFSEDIESENFIFVNQSGVYVTAGDSLEDAPEVPATIYGGTLAFSEWKLVVKRGVVEIYRAVYEPTDIADLAFMVEVTGGKLWNKEANAAYEEPVNAYTFKDVAYVVADDPDTFSYWKDQDGKKVSYSSDYAFVVARNVSLTAVYGEDVTEEVALNTYFQYDESTNELNIFAERSFVPGTTKKVVEVGALIAVIPTLDDEDIVIGSPSVARVIQDIAGAEHSLNGTYWAFLNSATVNAVKARGWSVRARGYIVCQDTVTGALSTVYTDPVAEYTF